MLSSNHFSPSQLQPIAPMLLCTLSCKEFMGVIFSGLPLPPHLPWAPGVNPTGDLWPCVPMYWSFLGSLQCQRLDHWFVKGCCNEVFISRAPTVQWSRVHFQKRTHSIHPEWQGFSLHAKHPGRGRKFNFYSLHERNGMAAANASHFGSGLFGSGALCSLAKPQRDALRQRW